MLETVNLCTNNKGDDGDNNTDTADSYTTKYWLKIPEMIFSMTGNQTLRWSEVVTYIPIEYILSFHCLWRGAEYATSEFATLAYLLFWAERSWGKADTR